MVLLTKESILVLEAHDFLSTRTLLIYLNPIPGEGGCKFAQPYPNVTNRKIWDPAGTSYFFTFNIIILDIFCENLAYVAPQLQIL